MDYLFLCHDSLLLIEKSLEISHGNHDAYFKKVIRNALYIILTPYKIVHSIRHILDTIKFDF
jgi:hypothetical protein